MYGHETWRLARDPFPNADSSLAPMKHPDHLDYYFDFYEWRDQARLKGISAEGRIEILQLSVNTTTILISGPTGCGRSSLENLLLYEITELAQSAPLILSLKLRVGQRDTTSRGLALANNTYAEVRRGSPEKGQVLLATIEGWKALILPGTQPDIANLFEQLRRDINDELPGALVIVSLEALDHTISYEAALDTADMVQGFADIVILSVTVSDTARYIRTSFTTRQRAVAWVNAPRVAPRDLKRYVEKRFGAERSGGDPRPGPLHPLTEEAIETVFASADATNVIDLPIRIAIQKLADVLRGKLRQQVGEGSVGELAINEQDVRRTLGETRS